jgi:beta-lactamase superfamily II metal-dependent hydrolase
VGAVGSLRSGRLGPAEKFELGAADLAVFVLNVGDGDAIVVRFPAHESKPPSFAVVDSFDGAKTVALIEALAGGADPHLRFVCATHPHWDHISGLRRVLEEFGGSIDEFWDSGFRFTSATYRDLIEVVVDHSQTQGLRLVRPTSGFETFHAGVSVTVLSPSIALRNRYDTHGVDINNASIVLRLAYPVPSPKLDYPARERIGPSPLDGRERQRTVILGGDAQTDAWSGVLAEFPHLDPDERNWARAIGARGGQQPLRCDFFKVPHHASKRGVNLELLERLGDRGSGGPSSGPPVIALSCATGRDSHHGFPHAVCQGLLREVRDPQAKSGGNHRPDDDLGIHYTSQQTAEGGMAGSIAYVVGPTGSTRLFRLNDRADQPVDLHAARRVKARIAS